jgi:hypothetical protein
LNTQRVTLKYQKTLLVRPTQKSGALPDKNLVHHKCKNLALHKYTDLFLHKQKQNIEGLIVGQDTSERADQNRRSPEKKKKKQVTATLT